MGSRRGLVCSSVNLCEPVESISLAWDLSAAHLRGRAGETAGEQAPDLPFNRAGLLRDAPAARGGKHPQPLGIPWERRGWCFGTRRGVSSQLWGRGRTRSRWGRGRATAPTPGEVAGHQQPLCPSSQAAPSKSRRAPAWPGSTGVSPRVSAAPCVFPSVAGRVPGTHCQGQQHASLGMSRGWGDTGGFYELPFQVS